MQSKVWGNPLFFIPLMIKADNSVLEPTGIPVTGIIHLLIVSFIDGHPHPSPNQEPTNSERKLVCGDWHPSENTDHPTHFLF